MPDPVDLGYAFTLTPERAVAYFESKGYQISWDWFDTFQQANARAFTVAKAMTDDILEDLRGAVDDALRNGTTFQQFKQDLEPLLQRKGWWGRKEVLNPQGDLESVQLGSVRRLKTIYRTNLQTGYMSGRRDGQLANTDNRPYWMYVAINDASTRPEHKAMHGRVFRWDDPIWQSLYPPNGWGCRCRIRALTERQVKSKGVTVESSDGKLGESLELVSKKTGELQPVTTFELYKNPDGSPELFKPDVGWSAAPGEGRVE